jgi:hypothetical protein
LCLLGGASFASSTACRLDQPARPSAAAAFRCVPVTFCVCDGRRSADRRAQDCLPWTVVRRRRQCTSLGLATLYSLHCLSASSCTQGAAGSGWEGECGRRCAAGRRVARAGGCRESSENSPSIVKFHTECTLCVQKQKGVIIIIVPAAGTAARRGRAGGGCGAAADVPGGAVHLLKLHAAVSRSIRCGGWLPSRGGARVRGMRGGRRSLAAVAVVVRGREALRGLPPAEGLTLSGPTSMRDGACAHPQVSTVLACAKEVQGACSWWCRRDKPRSQRSTAIRFVVRSST